MAVEGSRASSVQGSCSGVQFVCDCEFLPEGGCGEVELRYSLSANPNSYAFAKRVRCFGEYAFSSIDKRPAGTAGFTYVMKPFAAFIIRMRCAGLSVELKLRNGRFAASS